MLNGGEVAALAIIEAVVRLLPGFLGNAESLAEESHEDGLLEYPVYTKPASWRGLDVPDVLLSRRPRRDRRSWRHEQAVRRTAARRPDLLHPSAVPGDGELRRGAPGDAGELLTLQRACWVQEQQANPEVPIPALQESLDDVRAWLATWTVLVLRRGGRLVGAVRGRLLGGDRLGDRPADGGPRPAGHAGSGAGCWSRVEEAAPAEVTAYELFTGARSDAEHPDVPAARATGSAATSRHPWEP